MRRFIFLVCLVFTLPCLGEVRAVIFDFGGVMVSTDKEILMTCLEDRMNIHSLDGYSLQEVIAGRVEERAFWDELAGGALPDDWEVHFQQACAEATEPVPGMAWLVQHLSKRGYIVPLLSNTIPSCAQVNEDMGRYRLFDPVILSCEVGMAKPEEGVFEYTLGLLDLRAGECLFIDDNIENIETAESLGMEAIHFEGFEPLCIELYHRGIL